MNGMIRLGNIFERKGDIALFPLSNISDIAQGSGKWAKVTISIPREMAKRLQDKEALTGGLVITTVAEVEAEKKTEARKTPDIDYGQITEQYNAICISYPKCRKLSERRKKALSARVKSGYTMEQFQEVFERAERSSFLKGENRQHFKATLDWLLADSNMAKVLDGNYNNEEEEQAKRSWESIQHLSMPWMEQSGEP